MYQIPGLLKYKGLFHIFSEKSDGNMANYINGKRVNADKTLINRKKFLKKNNIPINKSLLMGVMGGDTFKIAGSADFGISISDSNKSVKTDGLITNQKGIYLILLVADCAPVILFDPINMAIGLAHVGWKGTDLELIKKIITGMKNKFKTDAKDIVVGIGPCVRNNSFIKENPSQKNTLKWQPYLKKVGDDRYKVNFVEFAKDQLIGSGVRVENIKDSLIDTAADIRFYSHTRESKFPLTRQGRFACIVSMK